MLILSRSAIRQGAELSKCGDGRLATAVVCVEGKRGGNGLSVHERDIPGNKNIKYYSNRTQRKL